MDTARRTLLSATLGTLAVLVAFTAPLANLNQTAAGLEAGPSGRTWILSSMSIGLGAFLLTAGRVADVDLGRSGRQRVPGRPRVQRTEGIRPIRRGK